MNAASALSFETVSGVKGVNGVYEFSVKNDPNIRKTLDVAKTLALTVDCQAKNKIVTTQVVFELKMKNCEDISPTGTLG